MSFNIRTVDLNKLNTLTKYPSIPTYHKKLEEQQGVLVADHIELPDQVIVTEKVNGVNSRIIFTPDNCYIVGSREELLYGRGDIVANDLSQIVSVLRPVAERSAPVGALCVFYFEVFGCKGLPESRQYITKGWMPSCRLFDVAYVENCEEVLSWPIEKIAGHRDHGGLLFGREHELELSGHLSEVQIVPRKWAAKPPTDLAGTYEWLKDVMPTTLCKIDATGLGKPEGVVVRTEDRSVIAKIRYEDYERTFRKRAK